MLLWGRFLKILREDGVDLGESEKVALTEHGERITAKMLIRRVDDKMLWIEVDFQSPTDRFPKRTIRQVMNRLRLPPEKYLKLDA